MLSTPLSLSHYPTFFSSLHPRSLLPVPSFPQLVLNQEKMRRRLCCSAELSAFPNSLSGQTGRTGRTEVVVGGGGSGGGGGGVGFRQRQPHPSSAPPHFCRARLRSENGLGNKASEGSHLQLLHQALPRPPPPPPPPTPSTLHLRLWSQL